MRKLPMKSPFGVAAKEKYIDDLPKYSMAQLLEMRERQLNLLANKWVHENQIVFSICFGA